MSNDLINFTQGAANLNLTTVIINIVLAFVLSLIVALVYRQTHKGLSYSQSFTVSLIMIGFLIASIVMVIGNSLALAFAAFGAVSLIRFRTAIKDSRDIAFILLVVAIGLASGTGSYIIAVVTTLFAAAVVYVLTRMNFGSIRKYDFVLSFSARTADFSSDQMRRVFEEFLKYSNLLNVASRESGAVQEYSFNIKFINTDEVDKFSQRLSQLAGVSDVDIISAKNDIEY